MVILEYKSSYEEEYFDEEMDEIEDEKASCPSLCALNLPFS